jgi:hypothetical protein
MTKFIVVHGKSQVDWVDIEMASHSSLLAGLQQAYGINVDLRKFIGFAGGVHSPPQRQGTSLLYQ